MTQESEPKWLPAKWSVSHVFKWGVYALLAYVISGVMIWVVVFVDMVILQTNWLEHSGILFGLAPILVPVYLPLLWLLLFLFGN